MMSEEAEEETAENIGPDDDVQNISLQEGADASFSNKDIVDPDIVATISALGSYMGSTYVKGDECSICIVDLIKFLRLENKKECDVRRQIAKSMTMEKDLLPILTTYHEDHDIMDAIVRLLVNLTMPPILCMEEEEGNKNNKMRTKLIMEINIYLREYKELFIRFNVMKVFSSTLGNLLQLGKSNRSDEDDKMLERLLITIRNILHIPSDSYEDHQLQYSLSPHDRLILSMIEYGVADLLLYLCGSKDEEQHCVLCLEIISLLFRDFDPKTLANQNTNRDESKIDKELQEIKMKENLEKQQKINARKSRHSRFGGTFVVQGKKSITDKDLIYHKNIKKIKNLSFDDEKVIKRHTRWNAVAQDNSLTRISTADVRNGLQSLAKKCLEVCYNPLMKKVKSLLCRSLGNDFDETFYLWSCKYFMEFNRCTEFKIELVAETLTLDTFSYILQIIFKFHEDIKSFSAKASEDKMIFARRLHKALKAYREMLENLNLMIISKDSKIKNIAGIIQNNIFYQQEYRELPTMLLKQFHTRIFTKTYLTDLIECTHIYIRMLDTYSKDNTLIVQETKKKPKNKTGTKKKKRKNMLSEKEMLEMWDGDIEKEVMSIITADNVSTTGVSPFDAVSDYSMEQQRIKCKHDIQDLLKCGSFQEAVALYKAAREVWPESPSFGMPDMSIIDEVNVVKSIFLSSEDIPDIMTSNDDNVSAEHAEVGTEMHAVKEHQFQNSAYLMLYARPGIVQSYCYLLRFFDTNSVSENHAAVKMLYRLASKLVMTPLMYQITFFITLQKILAAPKVDAYKELQKFATFMVRKFTAALNESPLLCIDTMFWKSPDDVLMIDHKYDQDKMPGRKPSVEWTPQEEEEIKELFRKWLDKAEAIDLCEMIAQDMTTGEKQRADVKSKILELNLVNKENEHILKKKPKSKLDWLPDEKEALRKLYEDFQYECDPVALIQEKLDTKSRKKIIKELGNLLGVRPKDLDVNRTIWSKDDDTELKILYEHLSEKHMGNSLIEAICEKIPKPRTSKEVTEALIRLRLKRDESSSTHFWTKAELDILSKYSTTGNNKDMVLKIRSDLSHVEVPAILQELVRNGRINSAQGATLLMEFADMDSDAEASDSEEEEFDFFDIPNHIKTLRADQNGALKWISGIVSNAIDAREETLDYDTIFIIPRQESHKEALNNGTFQQMLKCLGAVPPLSTYETYWKLTSDISDNILKRAYSLLTGDVSDSSSDGANFDDETFNKSLNGTSSKGADNSESDDDMESFFCKIRSQKPEASEQIESVTKFTLEKSDGEENMNRLFKESSKNKSGLVSDDNQNYSEVSNKENATVSDSLLKRKSFGILRSESDSETEVSSTAMKKKKRRAVIDSDSDE